MIDTPINRERRPQTIVNQVLARQLVPRMGQMDDVCAMLLFLCSGEAAFITGQTFLVDGGPTRAPKNNANGGNPRSNSRAKGVQCGMTTLSDRSDA